MDTTDWTFPTLAFLWEYRTGAIMAGGDRLDTLTGAHRERALAALTGRVRTMVDHLEDGWLVMTAFWMVEDLYKSFFRGFAWTPGVHDYLAATAAPVVQELTRRSLVLHYVIDATQGAANLPTMLAYLPGVFRAAGLAVVGPQLAAWEILTRTEGGPPGDLTAIQRQVGNRARRGGHPIQRGQCTADHQDARQRCDGKGQGDHHGEDQGDPPQGPLHRMQAQPDDHGVARLAAGGGGNAVAAETVEIDRDRTAGSGRGRKLPGRLGGHRGTITAAVERTGLGRRPLADDRGDHPGGLTRRVEELGPGPAAGGRNRRGRRFGGAQRRRGWWTAFHHRGALGDLQQLAVEFADQIPVQRPLGDSRDPQADHRQEGDLSGEQPGSQ